MIRLKHNLALLPLFLSLSSPVSAIQVLDAQDGETVLGKISRKEVTRIRVDQDRIRKVTGNTGEFVLEKDEDKGQIFIRPALPDSTKPINLFITSERGTFALLLQPVDIPSDTIVVRTPRPAKATVSAAEASGRHVRTVKNMLLVLAGDELPTDMEVREPGQVLALWAGTRLTLQRVLIGANVVGEKYLLTNLSHVGLALTERDFFKPGVIAVSIETPSLDAGGSTNLFVVRERTANE